MIGAGQRGDAKKCMVANAAKKAQRQRLWSMTRSNEGIWDLLRGQIFKLQ